MHVTREFTSTIRPLRRALEGFPAWYQQQQGCPRPSPLFGVLTSHNSWPLLTLAGASLVVCRRWRAHCASRWSSKASSSALASEATCLRLQAEAVGCPLFSHASTSNHRPAWCLKA